MTLFTTQPDEASSKDVRDADSNPTTNYATEAFLYVGFEDYNSHLEFDLSSIPAGSVCIDATLSLWSQANNSTKHYNIYSLHENVATWTETGLTWNNYKAGTAWPGSAGANTAGVDYESGAIGAIDYPNFNVNTEAQAALTPSRIEGWFGAVNTNYGIIVKADDAADVVRIWHSSSRGTAGQRPKFTVNYTEPVSGQSGIFIGML